MRRRQGTEQLFAFYDVHEDCLAGLVELLRTYKSKPEAVQFIIDMLEP